MAARARRPARTATAALAAAGGWIAATAASAALPGAELGGPEPSTAAAFAPGPYDAQFCVAVAAAPAQCGPVAVDVREGGRVQVRIADIVYRLDPWGDRLGITLMHGTMQIDGYFAPYRWQGRTLQFDDPEKSTRYELKLGARRFD